VLFILQSGGLPPFEHTDCILQPLAGSPPFAHCLGGSLPGLQGGAVRSLHIVPGGASDDPFVQRPDASHLNPRLSIYLRSASLAGLASHLLSSIREMSVLVVSDVIPPDTTGRSGGVSGVGLVHHSGGESLLHASAIAVSTSLESLSASGSGLYAAISLIFTPSGALSVPSESTSISFVEFVGSLPNALLMISC